MLDGKPAKYELPHRARLVLDVPPAVLTRLGSPARPLWITEGPLKADAGGVGRAGLHRHVGVWGWRGLATAGAVRPRWPAWEQIALAWPQLCTWCPTPTPPQTRRSPTAIGRLRRHAGPAQDAKRVRYVYLPTGCRWRQDRPG